MLAGKAFQSLAAVNAKVDDPGPRTRANCLYIVTSNNAVVQSRIVIVPIYGISPSDYDPNRACLEVTMYRIEYVPKWLVLKWPCPETSGAS